MSILNVNGCRVWIVPVESDPTNSLTPSQAPVIAVLATSPAPGATGAWYNPGTSSAGWRPLVSGGGGEPYVLPEVLQRWAESRSDEAAGLLEDLGPAGLDQNYTTGALSEVIRRIVHGIPRSYWFSIGWPENFTTGFTFTIRTVDQGTGLEGVKTFVFNKGDVPEWTPGEGEIEVNIAASQNAADVASVLVSVLSNNLWVAEGTLSQGGNVYLQTGFCGQHLQSDLWVPSGTSVSSGAIVNNVNESATAKDPFYSIHGVLLELVRAAAVQNMVVEINSALDPRDTEVGAQVFGATEYPRPIGQLMLTADGTKAYQRTMKASPSDDATGKFCTPLHRTRTYRGTEENVGTLFGYFDSPLLHAVKARRDVRLRWVIKGVNNTLAAADINLGLRVTATGNVTNFTMAKAIHTMGTPSEGAVFLHQNIAGLDYSSNGEIPLLLDFNLPIQTQGSGGDGIAPGASFGVTIEMILRIPHATEYDNWSGLGDNVALRKDLAHFRLEWDAWYRDQDNLEAAPLGHAHGEAQITDAGGGLAFEIERLGIATKTEQPTFWGQVSAIDPGSYVEIEYL